MDKIFKITFFLIIWLSNANRGFSQHTSGILLSEQNQEPIPFAEITVGESYGVITNIEGKFNIQTNQFQDTDSIKFYALGYHPKFIALKDFNDGKVFLEEKVEKLENVYLMNKNSLDPQQIMSKVSENISKNYASTYKKYTIFERSSGNFKMLDLDMHIKKADLISKSAKKQLNKVIDSISKSQIGKTTKSYTESFYEVYTNNQNDYKINLLKTTKLYNEKESTETEEIFNQTIHIITKKLDENKTFKLKSGLFTLKDSINLKKSIAKRKIDSTPTQIKKQEFKFKLGERNFFTIENFHFIENYKKYKFKLDKITDYKGEIVFVLNFEPDHGSSKYKGELYISSNTYAVIKMNYDLIEGEKATGFNMKFLLGVKMEEKERSGTLIFQKNELGTYDPKYMYANSYPYIYLNRDVLFKENKSGWFVDKTKLKFDILIENKTNIQDEYLFVNVSPILTDTYKNLKEKKGVPLEKIKHYDSSIWEGYNIISPDRELEEFKY